MLYPMLFTAVYKETIWGGRKLRDIYGRELPSENTGEGWDISCREAEMGIVRNGSLAGTAFCDAIALDRRGMLGSALENEAEFPLLIKLIDANDFLSVQVHPGDDYARSVEGVRFGKNELWYVLDAASGSYLIMGLKPHVSKEGFLRAIEDKRVGECLNKVYVSPGDVLSIPAGLIHAIGSGILLAEIQQNSDITYRLYDYNRVGADGKPRSLHIDKAVEVIDFSNKISRKKTPGLSIEHGLNKFVYYAANEYFAVIKYDLCEPLVEKSNPKRFHVFTCVAGQCEVTFTGGQTTVNAGDSAYIPAVLGEYEIRGCCTLLKSFVPDMAVDFISPLLNAGYSKTQILQSVSLDMSPVRTMLM